MSLAIRIIPVLLLRNRGLEKSIKFTDCKYVGCAVNAARVFSNRNADELILLDTLATSQDRRPHLDIVKEIADETFMPFTVGGGIRTVDDIWALLTMGADRVAINTAAIEHPELITAGAERFGRQCMVVSLDYKERRDGSYEIYTHSGSRPTGIDPVQAAVDLEAAGAGEILLTSIDRDGTLEGYDLALTRAVADAVSIPVIACGGAGAISHLASVCYEGHASAAAGRVFPVLRQAARGADHVSHGQGAARPLQGGACPAETLGGPGGHDARAALATGLFSGPRTSGRRRIVF